MVDFGVNGLKVYPLVLVFVTFGHALEEAAFENYESEYPHITFVGVAVGSPELKGLALLRGYIHLLCMPIPVNGVEVSGTATGQRVRYFYEAIRIQKDGASGQHFVFYFIFLQSAECKYGAGQDG